jgi:hypothetical protein
MSVRSVLVSPRFAVGDRVRVVNLAKTGHVRTPDYIIGCNGEIIQFCGLFLHPEDLSVGITQGPVVALYRVKFAMSEVWKDSQRHPADVLCIEIYDNWLSEAEEVLT